MIPSNVRDLGCKHITKQEFQQCEVFGQMAHFSNYCNPVQGAIAFMLHQYVLFTDVYACI